MFATAASEAAPVVSGVGGLSTVGKLPKLSVVSKCIGGVGLLETSMSVEMLTG